MARISNWRIKLNNICKRVPKLEIPNFDDISNRTIFLEHIETILIELMEITDEIDKKIKRTKFCDEMLAKQDNTNGTSIEHNTYNNNTPEQFEHVVISKDSNQVEHKPSNHENTHSKVDSIVLKKETKKYSELETSQVNKNINDTAATIKHDNVKHSIISHNIGEQTNEK